ncbi:MAG: pyruvate kinase, partial [Alphaproteobacteria bacterium]|nr:pyruvate kinase [Alphaproteobacteria bacterium]
MNRSTKIVATLGPASSTEQVIETLARAGANMFRLNFSHGSHDEQASRIQAIRTVEKKIGRPIGILTDLQGPKYRIGMLQADITLAAGSDVCFHLPSYQPSDLDDAVSLIPLPHEDIFESLEP